ncbi:MAG: DnaD domain protein [Clostridiaceae bacterium]|jgi:DnaD/phage-associated family protein|nr:DnaD domain protein [Clostridiaceae bacterium]
MYFQEFKSVLYSDTLVPDIFISEYLPSMPCEHVKVYLFCLFLSKYNKKATVEDLSKKLGLDYDTVSNAISSLESLGIVGRTENGIIILDLKEKEINKLYRPKTTSTPDEALLSSEKSKKRRETIEAINKNFFQGLMSPSWYTDIDAWFDKYKFEEDVMYALFQHCYDYKGLSPNYITKVADSWHSRNIVNSFDLDKYFIQYQKIKEIKLKIIKKLNLNRFLTEYEESYIDTWVEEYGFDFEIIEIALKKTTSKTNPNFNYINAILSDWFNNNLKTKEDIIKYDSIKKKSYKNKGKIQQEKEKDAVSQKDNFQQRKYTDEYYDKFFLNSEK